MAAASLPDPHYSDHTNFSIDIFNFPFPIPATWTDNFIGEDHSSNTSSNNAGINYKLLPSMNCDMNSPVSVSSFPETFGVSDCMSAPELSEFEMGFRGIAACNYKHQIFEPGEEFMLWPAYQMAAARGIIQTKQEARVEESEIKVGRYSIEERKGRILRYLQKRNQRNFNKTIKYTCRKTLADKRVRVRGRFAKNNKPCHEHENAMKINTNDHYCYDSLDEQSIRMKYEDDDWLEVAVASLAYLPYIS